MNIKKIKVNKKKIKFNKKLLLKILYKNFLIKNQIKILDILIYFIKKKNLVNHFEKHKDIYRIIFQEN